MLNVDTFIGMDEIEELHQQYIAEKIRNMLWDLRVRTVVGCALLTFKFNNKKEKGNG